MRLVRILVMMGLLIASTGVVTAQDDDMFGDDASFLDDLFGDEEEAAEEAAPEPVVEKGEPEPVFEPEPVEDEDEDLSDLLGLEDEPVASEPEPVFTPEPEPVFTPEPVVESAPIESWSTDEPAADMPSDDDGDELRELLGLEDSAEPTYSAPAADAPVADEDWMEEDAFADSIDDDLPVAQSMLPTAIVTPPKNFDMISEDVPLVPENPEGAYEEAEELVRERTKELQAMQDLQLGEKALMHKAYKQALDHFLTAEANLSKRLATADARRRANDGAMIAQYYLAEEKMKKGELSGDQGAQSLARRAFDRNRRFLAARRLLERIEIRITEQEAVDAHDALVRRKQDDYKVRAARVETAIRAGIQHMKVYEYDDAERMFKRALHEDPMNQSAIGLIKELQIKRHKIVAKEREATTRERMAEVTDSWNPRDYHLSVPHAGITIVGPEKKEDTAAEKLLKKMQNITIPELTFDDANINNVIKYLVDESRAADSSETDADKRGVNIILKLPDNLKDDPPRISLSAKYVSLKDAVDIVSDVAGLRYRVMRNIVLIHDPKEATGEIITRFYNVDPAVIARIEAEAVSVDDSGGGFGDEGGGGFLTEGVSGGSGGVDLKSYFRNLGVEFPNRTSISYTRGLGKLIVANTEENLTSFEKILAVFNTPQPQVEIETRFVDIAEDDLGELGLEWHMTDNFEVLQQKGSGQPLITRPRIQMNQNSADGGFSKNLRFQKAGEAGSLLAIQSVLTNPEMLVLLHAMEQKGHADLLSAPKITTQPGLEASVKVATEFIYPTEYRVESGGASGLGDSGTLISTPIVIPDVFETREVGVILNVLPEVSPDQSTITLTLAPEVVTEPYWHDYGYELSDGTVVPMKIPFFNSRNATTTIKVYDGATVVLGGLISESLITTDDKVPLLGSIPLIGGLFSSKSKQSKKRNLLIFVTARLVDPAGRPLKELMKDTAGATGLSVSQ